MSNISYSKVNTNVEIVVEDWRDLDHICKLMDDYGNTREPFFGKNDNDESIEIHINPDIITLITYQHNHWVRKNVYYRDGSCEELFEGKWS